LTTKRIIVLLFLASLTCLPVSAQHFGSSPVDPNSFDLFHSGPDINQNTKGYTLRAAQNLDPSVRNLVLVVPGQSNVTNVAPSLYTPANPTKIDQLCLTDGGLYSAADPMLSLTGTTGMPILRLADNLITSGLFDRVVIAPLGAGGTSVSDWETGIEVTKIPAGISRLKAKGLVNGTNVTVVFIWNQGEQDTNLGTSQAAYTTSMNNVIAASRKSGFSGLWFIPVETWDLGTASAAVAAAQAAVVNHGSNVWAGPNLDALVGNACSGVACRQGDNLHWSDAGAASMATAWQAALHLFGAPF
jgi:hypothetical protein